MLNHQTQNSEINSDSHTYRNFLTQEKIIKRALISVSDKSGLLNLVSSLLEHGVEIFASEGTSHFLSQNGIAVRPLSQISGSSQLFNGRVKTIDRKIFSCILANQKNEKDLQELSQMELAPFDLLIVNLYPFSDYLKNGGEFLDKESDDLVEKIDIGGVSLIRAGAKNFEHVCTLSSVQQYNDFLDEFTQYQGKTSLNFRTQMAKAAFNLCSIYDQSIFNQFEQQFPTTRSSNFSLCYGENPHQKSWLKGVDPLPFNILKGDKFSYNTLADSLAAQESLYDLEKFQKNYNLQYHATVIVKHQTPCGLALDISPQSSFLKAQNVDKISSFGGILATNYHIDENLALFLREFFLEVISAPSFSTKALDILKMKSKKLRLLVHHLSPHVYEAPKGKTISPGLSLYQDYDQVLEDRFVLACGVWPDQLELIGFFGLTLIKHLKSNAVAIVGPGENQIPEIWGLGQGQCNRLQALTHLAIGQAKSHPRYNAERAILISEAFMPFSDMIEFCHSVGIKSILAPKGSINDSKNIDCAKKLGMNLIFNQKRHFKH